ncbi:DDE family transposase [Cereibacter johrii]|uniref:DDE family transposase n=1 Tax=Cereibacter johrii TaxID=445629 RepID=A0ABX5J9Y5_9RHOB|nr:DDE family transposase [Cereibacter johrii]
MALRQTTGFVESLLRLIGPDWAVPDFSTLSRRQSEMGPWRQWRRVSPSNAEGEHPLPRLGRPASPAGRQHRDQGRGGRGMERPQAWRHEAAGGARFISGSTRNRRKSARPSSPPVGITAEAAPRPGCTGSSSRVSVSPRASSTVRSPSSRSGLPSLTASPHPARPSQRPHDRSIGGRESTPLIRIAQQSHRASRIIVVRIEAECNLWLCRRTDFGPASSQWRVP